MAYLPVNARSEFVTPTNASVGGVDERSLMFHAASSASKSPAPRPTLGSGLGAVVVYVASGCAGVEVVVITGFGAQADTPSKPTTNRNDQK